MSLTVDKMYLRPPEYYIKAGIETRFSTEVTLIDPAARLVKTS